jgi:xanthine dehydrogenase YagR molybdenum-binding subunit
VTNVPATSSPIGHSIARLDGPLKVTGVAKFAAEFARPRLSYGALIQSTIANGRVVKIDLSAAQSTPGVLGILTRENAPHFKAYPDELRKPGARAKTVCRCRTMRSIMTGNISVW